MKRVLIIAPHFAPVNAPDGQRARLLLPHLAAFGWECTVLAVDASAVAAPREDNLLATLPPDADVRRGPAVGLAAGRRFGVGNLGWRALPWLWREGSRLLASGRYDLVYFSTTQFACVPLGRWWRRRYGVPYVIDLQDPWRNDYYVRAGAPPPPGGWKYGFASRFAAVFERWTLRRCSHVISVSPDYLETLARRYPWFDSARGTVIPFGWSQRDLEIAARLAPPSAQTSADGHRTLLSIGRIGADMQPCLQVLFAGFARWRAANPARADVRLRFIGTSYDPRAGRDSPVTRAAGDAGIADAVEENPSRIGYLTALAAQQQADANLILGSADAGYSPSKIWPLLATRRPRLAVAPAGSVLADLLSRHPAGGTLIQTGPTSDIVAVAEWFDLFSSQRLPAPGEDELLSGLEAFALSRRHAAVFNHCLSP